MSSFTSLTISVIVPVYNGAENFRKCLSSLVKADPPADEIIIVADGDTDGSCYIAKEFNSRVLRLPLRQGPAPARNLGARIAKGDILFFIDAEVVIAPDAIKKVGSAFNNDPQLAARTIPWHGFYYFYSGLAFAIGVGRYLFSRGKSPKLRFSDAPNKLSDTAQHPELL